jgi:hypothetical protein
LKNNLNIEIFSGDFVGKGHTITQLAKFGSKVLKTEKVKTIILDENQNEKNIEYSEFYLTKKGKNPSEHQQMCIFHLGNNSQSVPIFKALIKSKASTNVVILHDVYLVDLFSSFLKSEYDTQNEIIYRNILGTSDYLLHILQYKNPLGTDKNFKAKIAVKFLNYFIPKGTYLIHGENKTYEKELENYSEPDNLHLIDLPIGYHEIQKNNKVECIYDVIVSGHASPSKEIDKIVSLLETPSKKNDLKILFLGSVARQIISQHPNLARDNKVKLIPYCSFEEWDNLHSASKLGLRIGVGAQGEKSGSVRDYLTYGMQVISDEETKFFKQLPNFNFYNGITPLESLISDALSKTTNNLPGIQINTVKEYYEKILGIIGAQLSAASEEHHVLEDLVKKENSFPLLNIKLIRLLSGKFQKISFIDKKSVIWKIDLMGIINELHDFAQLNLEENLDNRNSEFSKYYEMISYKALLDLDLNPENEVVIVESLANLVWLKGSDDTQKFFELLKINQIPVFVYKENRDTRWFERISNLNVVLDAIVKIAPWQNFEFKTSGFEPSQKVFFVSDKYQINFDDFLEDKSRLLNAKYKDYKSINNVTYISDSLVAKHILLADSRSTSQLFKEYLNWNEVYTSRLLPGDYKPELKLDFNPWGACLSRNRLEGNVLTELEIDHDRNNYLNLVFNKARSFGNLKLFPNDLRPWNVIVGHQEVQFIDFLNNIRKDEDADGIPQTLALYLTLEYIKDQSIEINQKIGEIRQTLSDLTDCSKREINQAFLQSWWNLENYRVLLLNESDSSEIIRVIVRK